MKFCANMGAYYFQTSEEGTYERKGNSKDMEGKGKRIRGIDVEKTGEAMDPQCSLPEFIY